MWTSRAQPKILYRSNSKSILSTAILSLTDFERIKQNAKFQSKDEEKNTHQIFKEQQEAQAIKSKNLKERMLSLDSSREPPDLSRVNAFFDNDVLKQAKRELDNNEDCVKQMNKFVLYAKTASIRDRQLNERKALEDMYRKKEERLDVMIEVERLKELQFQEEKEKQKKTLKREGSLVIIDQIKEKDQERLREKEQIEKEGIAIGRQIKEQEQIEKRLIEQKKVLGERMAREIDNSNRYAAVLREKKKLDEKQLDLKILEYNMEKVRKEEEEIAERLRLREEKEKEIRRRREKQEREQDKKAELDSLRTKRALEANELKLRAKEKEEQRKKEKLLSDLYIENEKQRLTKELKLGENAKQEHTEYEKILKRQLAELEDDRRKEEDRKRKRIEHCTDIRKQIKLKEENATASKKVGFDEGRELKQRMDNYRMRMESIKQEKLKELQSLSIDKRYITDLERYVIK